MLPAALSSVLRRGGLLNRAQPLWRANKHTMRQLHAQPKFSFEKVKFTKFNALKVRSFSTEAPTEEAIAAAAASAAGTTRTSEDDLELLRTLAVACPENSKVQYIYIKELNKTSPAAVVDYYNTMKHPASSESQKEYIKAMGKLDRLDEIDLAKMSTEAVESSSPARAATVATMGRGEEGSRGGSTGSEGARTGRTQGTLENPVVVRMAPTTWGYVSSILSFVLFGGLIYIFLIRGNGGITEMLGQGGTLATETDTKFSDVVGNDEVKEELSMIVDYLKAPARFTKFNVDLPKGVLMSGPPGCGKTLMARAMAGEAGVPFFYMSGSEFEEMFVGVGARRMRNLFKQAKASAPCVIFIDEIDAVGGKRDSFEGRSKMTLNQMLVEMDGFKQNSGVVVVAATNMPEKLDAALTRPGRFDRKVHVNLPDGKVRKQMLLHYLRDRAAPDVQSELDSLSKATRGMTGADIANLVNTAAIKAVIKSMTKITITQLKDALDDISMGPSKPSMHVSESVKRMTAYHEAGHALMGLHNKKEIIKATIEPRSKALGYVSWVGDDEHSRSKDEYLSMLDVAMGGRVAEELFFGEGATTSGASSDLTKATAVAKDMVIHCGLTEFGLLTLSNDVNQEQLLAPETKAKIDKEVAKLLDEAKARTHKHLSSSRDAMHRLANALIEYQTLSGAEIEAAVAGRDIKAMFERRIREEEALKEREKEQYGTADTPPVVHIPTPLVNNRPKDTL